MGGERASVLAAAISVLIQRAFPLFINTYEQMKHLWGGVVDNENLTKCTWGARV